MNSIIFHLSTSTHAITSTFNLSVDDLINPSHLDSLPLPSNYDTSASTFDFSVDDPTNPSNLSKSVLTERLNLVQNLLDQTLSY